MHKLQFWFTIVSITFICACSSGQGSAGENDTAKNKPADIAQNSKVILFFGDSITAGFGLDDPSGEAFPSVIQEKIDSLNLPYKIVNGGLSGETSAGGLSRVDWLLRQKVNVFVLELGANDGLRGLPVTETSKNLQAIINKVKLKYPDVKILLTGMMVPPNMGNDYAGAFKDIFPALAQKNHLPLVPFLLLHVAGIRNLNQADGIHPTARGARIVAENVWDELKKLL